MFDSLNLTVVKELIFNLIDIIYHGNQHDSNLFFSYQFI